MSDDEMQRLVERVEQLEAERDAAAVRRQKRRSDDDQSTARAELEDELAELEKAAREQRSARADLLEELADELDVEDPDLDRIADIRARLRRAERRDRELVGRHREAEKDLEDEMRRVLQRSGMRVRARNDEYDRGYPRERFATSPLGSAPISTVVNESGRLQNALLVGHIGMFEATANAVSALVGDIADRTRSRAGGPMQASMALPADVAAGLYTGVDELIKTPARAIDAFYGTYDAARR
ncbi:hypothetical protein OJ998_00830 [Solirubrobacter taibaiensis]|nr:hypothetical protein [Solirubrobacter taibaiensis]